MEAANKTCLHVRLVRTRARACVYCSPVQVVSSALTVTISIKKNPHKEILYVEKVWVKYLNDIEHIYLR